MEYLKDERVLLAVTATVVGLSLKMIFGRRKNLPPGPTVWPVVGSLPYLKNDMAVFKELAAKYGDVYFLELGLFGQVPTIVLNSVEAIREAIIQKQDDFAGRFRMTIFEVLGFDNNDLVFGDPSPQWRYQRKIAYVSLRKYATGKHFQELLERNIEMVSEIFSEAGDSPQDIYKINSVLVYNVVASLCFGKRYDIKDPEFNYLMNSINEVNELFNGVFMANLIPALKHIPTPAMRKLKEGGGAVHTFIDKQIAEHKQNFDENDVRDLTDYIIHSEIEMKATGLEEYQVQLDDIHYRQIIMDMFLAATDTSRTTLTWSLMYLASYPEIQKKAQEEIDENIGKELKINSQNRAKIPFTEAIIFEILRLRHPAPLSLPHSAVRDTSVGGYDIPKGTQVLLHLGGIHMDPKEWKDPQVFKPERFLDEHGNLAPKSNAFLPFSAGRRSCIGESLAKSELHILLGSLLQRYTFSLPGGKPIDLVPKESLMFIIPKCADLVVKER